MAFEKFDQDYDPIWDSDIKVEAVKRDPRVLRLYDEFSKSTIECKEDHIGEVLHKVIKKYNFETNEILEYGYTSNPHTIVTAYNKLDLPIKFVTFDAAMAHPELKYRSSTLGLYHKDLNKKLKKLNWTSDSAHSAIKPRIGEEEIKHLNNEQLELVFQRGQLTNSYNVTHGLKYTFGIELETCEGLVPTFIQTHLNCKTVRDGSVKGKKKKS
jgi:hypothetical protein